MPCAMRYRMRKDRCSSLLRQQRGWMTSRPRPIELRRMTWRGSDLQWLVPWTNSASAVPDLSSEIHDLAKEIAHALKHAQRPVVIAGASCNSMAIIQAAANVARALFTAGLPAALSFIVPECNSFGLALMDSLPLSQAFQAARDGAADTVVILENDLYRRAPDAIS